MLSYTQRVHSATMSDRLIAGISRSASSPDVLILARSALSTPAITSNAPSASSGSGDGDDDGDAAWAGVCCVSAGLDRSLLGRVPAPSIGSFGFFATLPAREAFPAALTRAVRMVDLAVFTCVDRIRECMWSTFVGGV